jgi:predicted acyltransferase
MPFSITKRLDRGDSRLDLYRHIFMRTLVLFAFGLLFNGILKFEFDSTRYLGVCSVSLCVI